MKACRYLLVALLFLTGVAAQAQVAVIANKSVSEGSIDIDKLRDIYFLRQKTWSDGSAIILLTLKSDNQTAKEFYGELGSSSMQMKKSWMRAQLTGEGQAPEALGSTEDILTKVEATPGAIGFVEASKVTSKVKVLLTIE